MFIIGEIFKSLAFLVGGDMPASLLAAFCEDHCFLAALESNSMSRKK